MDTVTPAIWQQMKAAHRVLLLSTINIFNHLKNTKLYFLKETAIVGQDKKSI